MLRFQYRDSRSRCGEDDSSADSATFVTLRARRPLSSPQDAQDSMQLPHPQGTLATRVTHATCSMGQHSATVDTRNWLLHDEHMQKEAS